MHCSRYIYICVCVCVCMYAAKINFFHIPSFSLKGPSFHSHQMAVPLRVCAYAEQLGEDIPAGSAKDAATLGRFQLGLPGCTYPPVISPMAGG